MLPRPVRLNQTTEVTWLRTGDVGERVVVWSELWHDDVLWHTLWGCVHCQHSFLSVLVLSINAVLPVLYPSWPRLTIRQHFTYRWITDLQALAGCGHHTHTHTNTHTWQVWFVGRWQAKLCDPLVTHEPYLSALEIRSLYTQWTIKNVAFYFWP